MGVLAASKPWPMSPPLNPSDFPGSNPHAIQATVISNYLRALPDEREHRSHPSSLVAVPSVSAGVTPERKPGQGLPMPMPMSSSPSSAQLRNRHYFQQQDGSPSSGRVHQGHVGMTNSNNRTPSPHRSQNQRMSMIMNTPPLYEIVRPKSAYFDEIEDLNSKVKACRMLEAEFQQEITHQRQRSEQLQQQAHARPCVPPPLPPNRPSSASANAHNNNANENGIITRADAHLLQPPTTPTCVPWLKKIKMVKKLKRKIGIGGNKSGTSFNNLPALHFHTIHGENVQLSQDGTAAKRINSFCKAIAFTDRAVKVNEKVCVKLIEMSINWSGVLRFGFTNQDPNSLRNSLPKYVCPDLTSRTGFWARAFNEKLPVKKDSILNFHVNSAGEIHFGIDGDDKGIYLSGVDTRLPLWGVFDIYGNTTAIELVDCRAHLNNSRPSLSESPACVARHQHPDSPSLSTSCQSSCSPGKYGSVTPSPIRSQIHHHHQHQSSQPHLHPIPQFVSARSLPDTPLYATTTYNGNNGYGQSPIATMSASYLPVPLPVKSTNPVDFSSANNRTNGHIHPRTSSSHISASPCSNSNPSHSQPSSVYKTPPLPKPLRDDYESLYLVKQSMSVKPGPGPCASGLANYVSIPSLVKIRPEAMSYSSSTSKIETGTAVSSGSPSKEQPTMSLECLACCERPVDSVFYSCGHMCMCFQCAVDYWRTKEKGHCPICRAAINDVIRTYT